MTFESQGAWVWPTVRSILLLLLLPLPLLLAAGESWADSKWEPTVIVLSWDGVRHDTPSRIELPGIGRLLRDGARAEKLIPIYPSSTFPNHVAIATCAHADRHGIIDNRFWDRERGDFAYSADASWIEAEPIWITAERQGVKSASFFWVGSETDWRGQAASYRITPFDRDYPEAGKVDQILAWLDLPDAERPRLLMSWWRGTDRVAHAKGPEHPDVLIRLAEQDVELVRLLEGLDARKAWRDTTLIVLSDHGMTAVDEGLDLPEIFAEAGIPARIRFGSSVANVYLDQESDTDRAVRLLESIPGPAVFRRDEVPEVLRLSHPLRSGDLVVLTEPPYYFSREGGLERWLRPGLGLLGYERGHHGYSPEHPDMAGIFFAMGRGVAPGTRLGRIGVLDVAPTVASLLGIEAPRGCEGSPIALSEIVAPAGSTGSSRATGDSVRE